MFPGPNKPSDPHPLVSRPKPRCASRANGSARDRSGYGYLLYYIFNYIIIFIFIILYLLYLIIVAVNGPGPNLTKKKPAAPPSPGKCQPPDRSLQLTKTLLSLDHTDMEHNNLFFVHHINPLIATCLLAKSQSAAPTALSSIPHNRIDRAVQHIPIPRQILSHKGRPLVEHWRPTFWNIDSGAGRNYSVCFVREFFSLSEWISIRTGFFLGGKRSVDVFLFGNDSAYSVDPYREGVGII